MSDQVTPLDDDSIKLSFSQREGQAPRPEVMQLDHVSVDFRNRVWRVVDGMIEAVSLPRNPAMGYTQGGYMEPLVTDYTVVVLQRPHDSITHIPSVHRGLLRGIVIEGEYHRVLTLVEFFLRSPRCPQKYKEGLRRVFEIVPIAYTVQIVGGTPTVVARASEESGAATQHAVEVVENKGPKGARAHLRAAVEAINLNQHAAAIRESIHAVESVARTIEPNAKTLGPALNALKQKGVLRHPALQRAFENLYGYTSDEKGIRHALLDEGAPDVDLDDAVFMFSACAAFAAYLVNRNEQKEDGREPNDCRR